MSILGLVNSIQTAPATPPAQYSGPANGVATQPEAAAVTPQTPERTNAVARNILKRKHTDGSHTSPHTNATPGLSQLSLTPDTLKTPVQKKRRVEQRAPQPPRKLWQPHAALGPIMPLPLHLLEAAQPMVVRDDNKEEAMSLLNTPPRIQRQTDLAWLMEAQDSPPSSPRTSGTSNSSSSD